MNNSSKNGQNPDILYLEDRYETRMPSFVEGLTDDDKKDFRTYVDSVIQEETSGFDKLFDSMSGSLKYLPNFFILSIIKKYIEPPVAARIAARLPIKQSLKVAEGVPVEYAGEVTRHLDSSFAASLVDKMGKKRSSQIISYMAGRYPLQFLDVTGHVSEPVLKKFRSAIDLKALDGIEPNTPQRKEVFEKIRAVANEG